MALEILWLAGPPAGALALGLSSATVRRAYGNGWHCVRRFPRIVLIPAFFSCGHILYSTGAMALAGWHATGAWPWEWLGTAGQSSPAEMALPALETVAAMLNCLVASFPLSAILALLFLVNYRGLAVVLGRALWRRHRAWGLAILAALVVCALAALAKPGVVLLSILLEEGPLRSSVLSAEYFINALSFVFEYLVGTCFQLYLLLMAYLWVRGMRFERDRLMRFAVRRISFVIKWALVVITATLLGIHFPLLVANLWIPGEAGVLFYENTVAFARPALAIFMLAFATVQITLALHNNSLRQALAGHLAFARRQAGPLGLFLGSAFLAVWTAFLLPIAAGRWAGGPADVIAGYAQPVFTAMLGGWILAAWVCFYKSQEPSARTIDF